MLIGKRTRSVEEARRRRRNSPPRGARRAQAGKRAAQDAVVCGLPGEERRVGARPRSDHGCAALEVHVHVRAVYLARRFGTPQVSEHAPRLGGALYQGRRRTGAIIRALGAVLLHEPQ